MCFAPMKSRVALSGLFGCTLVGRKIIGYALLVTVGCTAAAADPELPAEAKSALRKAAEYYRENVAVNGGYVYHTTADLKTRWGEGKATSTQIWVQPPGTPTVGLAYLQAYLATGDEYYLAAAKDTAAALCYGQLKSGGWQNCIDFDPKGRVYHYRGGRGGGKNYSSFDDDQTTAALRFLMQLDQALEFKDAKVHVACEFALKAVLAAQFPNGGFPQVFAGPATDQPIVKANFPDYDWRTEGRIKEYWNLYTLNDNVTGNIAETLILAHQIYKDDRYLLAVKKLGDFLILAQLPNPQPIWAQQYNYAMQPAWARKFEPAAASGDESQEAIAALLSINNVTGDAKYLKPLPAALAYLKKAELPGDGSQPQLARFYELRTGKPLYMQRKGDVYELTYSDADLPDHYGFKVSSQVDRLQRTYTRLKENGADKTAASRRVSETKVKQAIADLDDQGRWLSEYHGEKLVGQPKFAKGDKYLSSQVFADNVKLLSDYLQGQR